MGVSDRDWRGEPERGWFARVFGDGENPLRWSLPMYRAWGIAVRIHVVFVAIIIARLVGTVREDAIGFQFMLVMMAGLFVLVLLHEYGHCVACRRVGGEADEILMWPLGGLASCLPPNTSRGHLITVLGGPAVNAALLPVLGGAVLMTGGGWGLALFNPFDVGGAAREAMTLGFLGWSVWSLHLANAMLLAFNVLVPMYPMDGARIVHALMWKRVGRSKADFVICRVGLVAAIVLGTLAFIASEMILLGIAIFGGFVSYQELQRARFVEAADEDWSMTPDPPSKREKPEKPGVDPEEIDRILAKISREGMGSLTRAEKKKLERASTKNH